MSSQNIKNIFITTASHPEAAEHVKLSVITPIENIKCENYFDDEFLNNIKKICADNNVYAWGSKPGPKNKDNWEDMSPNDYLIFYQNGRFTFLTTIIATERNEKFARALWGEDDDKETWECLYFLQPSKQINLPAEEITEYIPKYRGLTKLPEERIEKIVDDFGSLEKFIETYFTDNRNKYFLIRSNEDSSKAGWDDVEGKSYHYGSTVPNYKSLVEGSIFIMDRRFNDGKKIIGKGKIGKVETIISDSDKKNDFIAHFKDYESIDPPRNITKEDEELLKGLPSYNIQHSIRKINKEVYERLTDHKSQNISEKPDLQNDQIIDLLKSKGQIILYGPPGTGKTFFTKELSVKILS